MGKLPVSTEVLPQPGISGVLWTVNTREAGFAAKHQSVCIRGCWDTLGERPLGQFSGEKLGNGWSSQEQVSVLVCHTTRTKYHKQHGLYNRNQSQSSRGWKSKIKVLAKFISSEHCEGKICLRLPSLACRCLFLASHGILSVCVYL